MKRLRVKPGASGIERAEAERRLLDELSTLGPSAIVSVAADVGDRDDGQWLLHEPDGVEMAVLRLRPIGPGLDLEPGARLRLCFPRHELLIEVDAEVEHAGAFLGVRLLLPRTGRYELREHARWAGNVAVLVARTNSGGFAWMDGRAVDISAGGVKLALPEHPRLGEVLVVAIPVGSDDLLALATVLQTTSAKKHTVVRCSFTDLPSADVEAITELVIRELGSEVGASRP